MGELGIAGAAGLAMGLVATAAGADEVTGIFTDVIAGATPGIDGGIVVGVGACGLGDAGACWVMGVIFIGVGELAGVTGVVGAEVVPAIGVVVFGAALAGVGTLGVMMPSLTTGFPGACFDHPLSIGIFTGCGAGAAMFRLLASGVAPSETFLTSLALSEITC